MKTIIKELNLLDIEEIEKAISSYIGHKKHISISEVNCRLVHCIPCNTEEPNGMYLDFNIDGEWVDSVDLFWDDDKKGYYLDGKLLALTETWLSPEEIFNFDTTEFKSFDTYVDGSD